jgi:cytochrome c biogenesis protein CcmG, thiol:disulfide interchange protein DsbE
MPAERTEQKKKGYKIKDLVLPVGGLLIGLLLGYLIITGNVLNKGPVNAGPPEIGQPIPDFELESLNGEILRLSQYHGHPVVVNFWGTWCPPCVQEMPLLEEVYSQKKPDLVILGVNEQDSSADAQQFVVDFNIHFPILVDEDGRVADQYQVRGFPTTFFVDAEGVLRAQHIGGMDETLFSGYLIDIGID